MTASAEDKHARPADPSADRRPSDSMPTVLDAVLLMATLFFLALALVQLVGGHPPDTATVLRAPTFLVM